MASERPPAKYGFASMPRDRVRAISSKGGKSVPDEKRAFFKARELASAAGRKGGLKSRHRQTSQKETGLEDKQDT